MATATVTLINLTPTQRAAIRRNVNRRNDRMWDSETFVEVKRGKVVVTSPDAKRAAHAEARSLMLAIGRTFDYDVEVN